MTENLRGSIAKIAEAHAAMGYDSDYGPSHSWVCNCGVTWAAGGTHGEHVADAVTRDVLTPGLIADLIIQAIQKAAASD